MWMLIPDEALPLLMACAGLLLILGFRRAAGSLLASVLIIVSLAPFIEGLLLGLPPAASLMLLIAFGWLVLSRLFAFSSRRADAGSFGAALIKLAVQAAVVPLRLLWWAVRPRRRMS